MTLRDYQQECIEAIESAGNGRWLVQMACGTGKTVIFTSLPLKGRTLIVAHREELLHQPAKYYTDRGIKVGFEKSKQTANSEQVVVASVQTLHRRLNSYSPLSFCRLIIDEAHHATAATYQKIIDYFKPEQLLGFTATPNRADDIGLGGIFDDIIFKRDIRWGIENGWLSRIECKRVKIGYDLSRVATRMGDFAVGDLSRALNIRSANQAIAEVVENLAKPPVLIYAVDVNHAHSLAECLPGFVAMDGTSKNRQEVIEQYRNGKIRGIVNCMLYTEGVDLPNTQTVIMARPTQSEVLYIQCVGRVLRTHPDKQKGLLIDCVGNSGQHHLCSAPTLIGLDMDGVPEHKQDEIIGDLLEDLPELIEKESDTPETWIRNIEIVKLWAKKARVKTHRVNYFKCPDGGLVVLMKNRKWVRILPPDLVGRSRLISSEGYNTKLMPLQAVLDEAAFLLSSQYKDQKYIWDLNIAQRWGRQKASPAQKDLIKRVSRKEIDPDDYTKMEAGCVLNRLLLRV